MLALSFVLAILLGYILGGRLKNLQYVEFKYMYIALIAFSIEFIVFTSIRRGAINKSIITFLLMVLMYSLLMLFVYLNRNQKSVIVLGLGVFLNAVVILLNGGAMPVDSVHAINIGMPNISQEGLYILIDETTKLWFLGDVIPFNFIANVVVSLGDIFIALGIMLIIINGMRKTSIHNK